MTEPATLLGMFHVEHSPPRSRLFGPRVRAVLVGLAVLVAVAAAPGCSSLFSRPTPSKKTTIELPTPGGGSAKFAREVVDLDEDGSWSGKYDPATGAFEVSSASKGDSSNAVAMHAAQMTAVMSTFAEAFKLFGQIAARIPGPPGTAVAAPAFPSLPSAPVPIAPPPPAPGGGNP